MLQSGDRVVYPSSYSYVGTVVATVSHPRYVRSVSVHWDDQISALTNGARHCAFLPSVLFSSAGDQGPFRL